MPCVGTTILILKVQGEGPDKRPEGGEWEPLKILQENKAYVPNSTDAPLF